MAKPINWSLVAGNLAEARAEIEAFEAMLKSKHRRSEVALQLSLEHAYHHLNVAWNARRASAKQYRNITDAQFNRWGIFPRAIEAYRLPTRKRKVRDV